MASLQEAIAGMAHAIDTHDDYIDSDSDHEAWEQAACEERHAMTKLRLGCAVIKVCSKGVDDDFGEVVIDDRWGISCSSIVDCKSAAAALHEWCPDVAEDQILRMILVQKKSSATQQSFRYSTHLPLFNKASAIQQSFRYSARPPPD